MEKVKWTCWIDEEKKAKGAVVGTRKAVLDWMKKTYPGLRKARDGEMVPAWYFFWENDVEHYQSANGEDLYLVRGPAEEYRKESTPAEEKSLEQAIRNYGRICRKQYAERRDKAEDDAAKTAARGDDVVADEVAKAILETAHLKPIEQKEKLEEDDRYISAWLLCHDDMWPIIDIVNRLMHDEVAAREYLCDKLFHKNNVDSVILCSRIRSGKFIHFQMTRAFNGGMDAYVVFRTPKTHYATIIRLCYM